MQCPLLSKTHVFQIRKSPVDHYSSSNIKTYTMTRNVQLKQTLELDEWASSVGVSETDRENKQMFQLFQQ